MAYNLDSKNDEEFNKLKRDFANLQNVELTLKAVSLICDDILYYLQCANNSANHVDEVVSASSIPGFSENVNLDELKCDGIWNSDINDILNDLKDQIKICLPYIDDDRVNVGNQIRNYYEG